MRKITLLFVVVLVLIFSACGKEGPGMERHFPEIYFKNELKKEIVVKAYTVHSTGEVIYTKKIPENEIISLVKFFYPLKIEVYDSDMNKLIANIKCEGSAEEYSNYPKDKELKVISYEVEVTPDDEGVEYVTKITLTQNLEHEVWK